MPAIGLRSEPPSDVPLGLYLHIPFCRKRCKFCYSGSSPIRTPARLSGIWPALSKEIELVSQLPCLGERPFRFVYFGGGTPSFLSSRSSNASSTGCDRTSIGIWPRKSRSNASPAH